jgi:hypothetical protein
VASNSTHFHSVSSQTSDRACPLLDDNNHSPFLDLLSTANPVTNLAENHKYLHNATNNVFAE